MIDDKLTLARGNLDVAIEAFDVFIDDTDKCELAFRTHSGRLRWQDERERLKADIVMAARELRVLERQLVSA